MRTCKFCNDGEPLSTTNIVGSLDANDDPIFECLCFKCDTTYCFAQGSDDPWRVSMRVTKNGAIYTYNWYMELELFVIMEVSPCFKVAAQIKCLPTNITPSNKEEKFSSLIMFS